MKRYKVVEETIGYVTAENLTNTDERHLVAGSRNVLIDRQRKVSSRNGNTLLGTRSADTTQCRNGLTWNTSTGTELMLRTYDDELEVYLGTVDGTTLNNFYRVANGFPTTGTPRFTLWYDDTNVEDILLSVWGDTNVYEWNGAVAVVDSVAATTVTKKGTNTFAQNRFYTASNKILVNTRTGTEYTYTGGEDTTTLTGIADTSGIQAGDVLVQKIITTSDVVSASRNNHTIFTFENQVLYGSDDDQEVYMSANDDYADFTFSAPRVPGEGTIFTLDDPVSGFGVFPDNLIIFAGKSSIYRAKPEDVTVGSTQAEIFRVRKYNTGLGQSAQNQEVIQNIGDSLIYLSHEPAVRQIYSPDEIQGGKEPRTLSNPIKPDFDAEDWSNACAIWYKNAYYLSAPTNGRVYILEYVEDADGRLRRFWQPPQTMFVRAFVTLDDLLYGHVTSPNTYRLFNPDAYSDEIDTDEKVPIKCVAKFAYRSFGDRFNYKNFDEFAVEGEISPSTDILMTINYDFGGATQSVERTIEGGDIGILLETLENTSLAQQPLGQEPIGGSVQAPDGTAKFRVIFEMLKIDFVEVQDTYETDDVDKFWSIIARGPNAQISRRQNVGIKR